MATKTCAGSSAALAFINQAAISARPSPLCSNSLWPSFRPSRRSGRRSGSGFPNRRRHTNVPFDHGRTSRTQRRAAATFVDPCTGARAAQSASGANSPRDVDRGQSPGHKSPPGGRTTGGNRSLPKDWLGFRTTRHFFAPRRRSRYVPLRYTSRERRRAVRKPQEKWCRGRDGGRFEPGASNGRPLGDAAFVAAIEARLGRSLAPGRPGPKPRRDCGRG